MEKTKIKSILPLFLLILIFLGFGFYHLSKFETVDEHFWRFERTPQYWQALKNQEWKKTYINDKPGITVALISGIGLFFEPHPETQRIRDVNTTQNGDLTVYDYSRSDKINLSLRSPIIIFNGLLLFLFFWLIKKITEDDKIALFSVFLIALSPILIGISQIMNPDAFLWSFSFAAMLNYFVLLKTGDWRFVILTGIFTGLSLLSKYSANILFPLYILSFCLYFIYNPLGSTKKYFLCVIRNFFIISAISVAVYSIFLPAVFTKWKYLYRGTIGMPGMKIMLVPMVVFLFLISADAIFLKSRVMDSIGNFFKKYRLILLKTVCFLSLLVFSLVMINCWLGQRFIPFDNIKDSNYLHPKLGLEAPIKNPGQIIKLISAYLTEFYPFVFSLSIPVLILVIGLWIKITFGKKNTGHDFLVFFISFLSLIYFLALQMTEVSSNARYSIMLYPLFYVLAAISFFELMKSIDLRFIKKQRLMMLLLGIIFMSSFISLWQIRPFYFNYTNGLLPKQFSIHDAWGYGEYEAAQYLNSRPGADNLLVWSDRNGICQFILGKCISGYKIDLNNAKPDYFIFSSRGSMRYQFQWTNPELAQKTSTDYYKKAKENPEWSILIDNRPKNYVKVVKSEE